MRLAYPYMLLFLLVIPALLWLRYHRARRPWLFHSQTAPLNDLPVSWAVRLKHLPACCYALGLLLLVGAMARPQRGIEYSRIMSDGVDIVLVIDTSTSMLAEDFGTRGRPEMNRLEAVKLVAEKFIRERTRDRIGLVNFAALPYTVSPLTFDHGWLIERIAELRPGMLEDGTAIGDGLAAAINRLRESEAKSKVVILLTDGVNNTGQISPINAAHLAKARGIRLYTIGAGSRGMARIPIQTPFGVQYVREQSDIDDATLTEMAKIADGRYFRATSAEELAAVYAEIDRMERTELVMDQYSRYEERFAPLLALGAALILLDTLLSATRLGRLP